MGRKKDVFAMMGQLGKPTAFLTCASEYNWPKLLRVLVKLKSGGVDFEGEHPVSELSNLQRSLLVNEDPVTCCVYFNKLLDTIMHILSSRYYSPFGQYHVKDYFKRIVLLNKGIVLMHTFFYGW